MAADPELVAVDRHTHLLRREIEFEATTSSGPGGQHANRSHTAIVVRLVVADCSTLSPAQKALLVGRLGAVVTARAEDHRSQTRNRELALGRLARRVADALEVEAPRQRTRPTRASVRRRLDDKRQRGDTKTSRRRPRIDD